MAFEIDIKTRAFHDDEIIYRLFPGQSCRHFYTMRDHNIVFLDMPGVPFPGKAGYSKTPQLLQEMAKADARAPKVSRSLRRKDQESALLDLYKDLEEIDSRAWARKWSQRASIYHSWMNSLYSDMRVGDVVMVPSPLNHQNVLGESEPRILLIGVINAPAIRLTSRGNARLNAAKFLARPVSWLGEMEEREVANFVIPSLRTSNVLVRLKARSLHQAIGSAYHNVNIGKDYFSRFTTQAEFTASSNFHFSAFAMAVSAAYQAAIDGKQLPKNRSIYELAASIDSNAIIPIQDILIRSPGYTTLRHATKVALVVSVLFALAGSSTSEHRLEDLQNSLIVNSEVTKENICEPIREHVNKAISIMGYERWQQGCRANLLASEGGGLASAATVRIVR